MKLHLKCIHHQPSKSLTALLRQQLSALQASLQIDEAHALLAHHPESSPPFRAAIHLVTPGPDVQAESTDHTLRAALQKAFNALEQKISSRKTRPIARRQTAAGKIRAPKPSRSQS